MQQVKNIIFDFGGVFIDIDYSKTERAFVQAGIANFNKLYSQHAANDLFEKLEKGEIDSSLFYDAMRKASGAALSNDQIDQCWNSMLDHFYVEAIEMAKQLKDKYRLFLFSNTNIIHYNFVMDRYEQQFGKRDFLSLFEKAYFSHTSHIRKPYPEAYEWVLNDAGLVAGDTLFIDDTSSNIEGAKKAGLQTIFLKPPMRVWELGL